MLVTRAPAKLNLFLDVLGRRPDGYHELATLFVALDVGDDVTLDPTPSPGVTLAATGPVAVPAGDENLAVGAARGWFEALGAAAPFRGAAIGLQKRIPLGAGLGGGSSDAAAVLRLLQQAAGPTALSREALGLLAMRLGADVPFFLSGGAAIGRRRGDVIEPVPFVTRLAVLLVAPPWGHETARVFAHFGQPLRPPPQAGLERAVKGVLLGSAELVREAHYNALALAAMRAYPAFTRFVSNVEARLGRAPCLSGTGSTLYDVFDRVEEAHAAAARLAGLDAHVLVTRFDPGPNAPC
jgi:4-diphosphocytidyl-2-C-methyl-D-erythritol kinase